MSSKNFMERVFILLRSEVVLRSLLIVVFLKYLFARLTILKFLLWNLSRILKLVLQAKAHTGDAYVIIGRIQVLYTNSLLKTFRFSFLRSTDKFFAIPEAFPLTAVMCFFHVSLRSKITPRYLASVAHSRVRLLIVSLWGFIKHLEKYMATVLFSFILTRHKEHHCMKRSKWCCKSRNNVKMCNAAAYSAVSSAYEAMFEPGALGMSQKNMLNSIGPKTEPCIIPDRMLSVIESVLLNLT